MTNPLQFGRPRALVLAGAAGAILAGTTFQACQKTDVQEPQSQPSVAVAGPTIVDGRVAFADLDHLASFMARFDANDEATYGSLAGFPSYRLAVEQAFDLLDAGLEAGEGYAEALDEQFLYIDERLGEVRPNVPDGFFAAVLNHDGEVEVGNEVHRYTRDVAYTYAKTDGGLELIKEEPTDFVVSEEVVARDANQSCTKRMNGSSRRRMKGETQKNNFVGWSEIRMLTKRQKKRLGIWSRRDADYLELRGHADAFQCVLQKWDRIGVYAASGTNRGQVDDASGRVFGLYCGETTNCTHKARKADSSVECDTNR